MEVTLNLGRCHTWVKLRPGKNEKTGYSFILKHDAAAILHFSYCQQMSQLKDKNQQYNNTASKGPFQPTHCSSLRNELT